MGAGLLRQRLIEAELDHRHQVASAGVWAVDEHPATENAVATMAERDIDITDHIAHTLNAADVAESDLILVMSREHARVIRNTWPQYEWKVHRVSEMAGKRKDVRDPYGGPIEEYRTCADTISGYIDRGFERILELAEGIR
jgi:protein-tyrosine-phosphatase